MASTKQSRTSARLQIGKRFLRSVNVYTKIVLRSLGLAILRPFTFWQGSEEPKVALRKSRTTAAARASIHFIPLTACAVILGYNLRIVFVNYNPAYTALQYVAKLHELLMQASIAATVLSYIRHTLIGDTPLPFGALLAANQVQNISTALSLEFWGAVTAPFLGRRRRGALFFVVLGSVLLSASVGPSSAILMQPRTMQPQVGSLDIYINETVFFPPQMDASTIGIPDMEAAEQALIVDLDDTPWIAARWLNDAQVINTTYTYSISQGVPEYTVCSPTVAALYIDNASWDGPEWKHVANRLLNATGWFSSYLSKQACAKVHCTVQNVTGNRNSSFLQLLGKQDSSNPQKIPGLPANLTLTTGDFLDSYNEAKDAHLIWLPPPEPLHNYSIVAVYAPSWPQGEQTKAWTCSIQAAWLSSRIKTSNYYTGDAYTEGNIPLELEEYKIPAGDFEDLVFKTWTEPTIPLSVEWANKSLSTQATGGDLELSSVVTIQDLFHRLDAISSPSDIECNAYPWNDCAGLYLTAVLGTVVTTAMALRNLSSAELPKSAPSRDGSTKVSLDVYGIGIGYCINTVPDYIATTVLFLYCTWALVYLTWSVCSGLSSNSWDSVGELVALALNSTAPAQLKHTSAGIEKMNVFREPVRIMENEAKSLELIFESEHNLPSTHKKLNKNQKY